MIITSKINMDLQRAQWPTAVNAVQGDQLTRAVELSLFSNGAVWMIPEGITVAVRYCKPDRTRGYYDTMPDGETAWGTEENRITVLLAPQMLTVGGTVLVQVEMLKENALLSTFEFQIYVQENPAAGVLRSEDYINWLQWMEEELKERMNAAIDSGEFVGPQGPEGPPGDSAVLVSSSVTYCVSGNMEEIPDGDWSENIPVAVQGKYLWTRTVYTFNSGSPVTSYTVSRMGIDGSGTVASVAGVLPDADGNVPLCAQNVGAIPVTGGTMQGPVNMNGQSLSGLSAPTEASQAVNKGYLDASVLPITGGTMQGPVNMNGQRISGLAEPSEDAQAANKGYVDKIRSIEQGGTGAATAAEALANLGGVRIDLVWENAALDSNFEAQEILLDVVVDDYDFGIAEFRYAKGNGNEVVAVVKTGNTVFVQNMINIANDTSIMFMNRSILIRESDNYLKFGAAVTKSTATGTATSDNSRLIPRRVWLVKGVKEG